jgi:hypothetical protein
MIGGARCVRTGIGVGVLMIDLNTAVGQCDHPGPPPPRQVSTLTRCGHPSKLYTKRIYKNGNNVFGFQCRVCGEAISKFVSQSRAFEEHKLQPYAASLFDNELRDNWWSDQFARQQFREKSDFSRWYDRYLKSRSWQEKRLKVLHRSQFRCEGCGADNKATQVHHLTYENVGYEFLFQLVAVCKDCHKNIHNMTS